MLKGCSSANQKVCVAKTWSVWQLYNIFLQLTLMLYNASFLCQFCSYPLRYCLLQISPPLEIFCCKNNNHFQGVLRLSSWEQAPSTCFFFIYIVLIILIILLQFEILPLLFVCDNNLSNHKCLTFKLLKLESIRNLCDIQQPWMACLRLSLWGVVITFGVPRPTPPFNFFFTASIFIVEESGYRLE